MTRGRRLGIPVLALVVAGAAFVGVAPSLGSGAYLTTNVTAAPATVGTAQWCATPDPSSNGRAIRLSSLATSTGASGHIAIIPVADNAAWGGGVANANLSVRLWGCQDGAASPVPAELADTLRITGWSNPGSGAGSRSWLAGSETVAPGARLDPATGLGAQLTALAQAASQSATKPLLIGNPSGALRQYSWIVSSARAATAATSDPSVASCGHLASLAGACTIPLTNASGGDNAFSGLFDVQPWDSATAQAISYPAHTFAVQGASGWASPSAYLNENCAVVVIGCQPVASNLSMTATSATAATLLPSTNGNLLQWLVIQWNGTTTPTDDVVVEVVLS